MRSNLVLIDLLDLRRLSSGGADPGERAEWGPVHVQHPGGSAPWRQPQRRGGQGDMGEEDRLPPVCDWLRRRPRQRLEVPVLVLQERRR